MLIKLDNQSGNAHRLTPCYKESIVLFLGTLLLLLLLFLVLFGLNLTFLNSENAVVLSPLQEVFGQSETTNSTNNFLTYKNDTYGITIDYPVSWSYYESGEYGGLVDVAVFQSPLEGRTDPVSAFFTVSIDNLGAKDKSLQEYVDDLIPSLSANMYGFNYQIVESKVDEGVTLAGLPAYRIISTNTQDGINFKTLELGTIIDAKVYVVSYNAEEAEYNEHLPVIEQMIKSYRVSVSPENVGNSVGANISQLGSVGALNNTSATPTGVEEANLTSGENVTMGFLGNLTGNDINQTGPLSSFVDYENLTYGFKLLYPSTWEKQVIPSGVVFASPFENMTDQFREGISILIGNIQLPNGSLMTLDNYINSVIDSFAQGGSNITILERVPITLTGNSANPATKLSYLWNDGQKEMKTMEIYTIKGNNVYTISYGSPLDKFDLYLPIIQKIIDSLQIQPALAGAQSQTTLSPNSTVSPNPPTSNFLNFSNNYLDYDNPILGIKMQYPSDWEVMEFPNNSGVAFGVYLQGTGDRIGAQVGIWNSTDLPTHGESNEQYFQRQVNNTLVNALGFILQTQPESIEIDGNPAFKAEFVNGTETGPSSHTSEIWTVKDDRAYQVETILDLRYYDDYLPIVQKMVDSIRILPVS